MNKILHLCSQDAEQSVLGGLLLQNNAWELIEDFLTENDFFYDDHKIIFREIKNLFEKNSAVDMVTLCNRLEEKKEFNLISEIYIVDLIRNTPTAANIKHYAKIVKRHSQHRQLLSVCRDIEKMIENSDDDICDKAETLIFKISEDKSSEPKILHDGFSDIFQKIQDHKENKNKLVGLSSGYCDLDKITKGFKKANFIVIGARPNMGKTQLALNIAEHISIKQNETVLMFSMEMTAEELKYRILSSLSKVSYENIQTGDLNTEEETKIANSLSLINQAKLFIDERAALKLHDIRATARRLKRKYGLALIIVDYLTLIHGEGENETSKVAQISRGMKELAKELNVPVIALSQLNRSLESRENKRPLMSDVRQSGQIEQDADIVMCLYRDEVYNTNSRYKNLAEVIVRKNRTGRCGTVYLNFHGDHCRFENYFGPIPEYQEEKPLQKKWNHGFKRAYDFTSED